MDVWIYDLDEARGLTLRMKMCWVEQEDCQWRNCRGGLVRGIIKVFGG